MTLLTEDQLSELCIIIDWWYLRWKNTMTDSHCTHRLGHPKEELKNRIAEKTFKGKL